MDKSLHALDYLEKPEKHLAEAVCVVYGDETFLKREVVKALRYEVLGGGDGEISFDLLAGRTAEPRDVWDRLATVSMFGGDRRMVVIEDADDFVSRNRKMLEDYIERPLRTGVLVLEVKRWQSNTRLYKAVSASGWQVECKKPAPARLKKWLIRRTKKIHQATVESAAIDLLFDLVEPEIGLLDQELARLALLTESGVPITPKLVDAHVGSWRAKTTWDLIDDAAAGNAQSALLQLDRLILAGENPIALMGQIASTFRRFARATMLIEQAERESRRTGLRAALEQAGFKPFVLSKAEGQLRQIGRGRGQQLYRWLLEADLALKGTSSAPDRARLVLELLVVRLSTRMGRIGVGPTKARTTVP